MSVGITLSSVLSALVLLIALALPSINSRTVPFGVRVPGPPRRGPHSRPAGPHLPVAGVGQRDHRCRGRPWHLCRDRQAVAAAAVGPGDGGRLVRLLRPGQSGDPGGQGSRGLV